MPNKVLSVSLGAFAIAVGAPVVTSVISVVSVIWPVVPLILVGGIWTNVRREKNNNNNTPIKIK